MAGFDDSSKTDAASDFSPGAQVPLSGASGQTAATQALASAAYRDDEVEKLIEANPEASFKKPKISLFEPNLGEAFARAVQTRLLGGARAPSSSPSASNPSPWSSTASPRPGYANSATPG